jgi:hypothetical protein
VKFNPDWQATGWLGIITAGSLWTGIDVNNLVESAEKIAIQIGRTMDVTRRGGAALSDGDSSDLSSTEDDEYDHFSVDDMRGELERLMSDLRVAKYEKRGLGATNHTNANPSGLSPLPAGVPRLPTGLRVTVEMQALLCSLLEPIAEADSNFIGFCGMGGLGKTVVSTWLVRQTEVRAAFNQIVWVTFGQNPNLSKLLSIAFLQIMGTELSAELNQDEVKQTLKHALEGKSVLFVFDDVWERSHADELVFMDESTESKVLISTRVRGVLEGGVIIDLTLPSDQDALQMLLNEAGLDAEPSEAPAEALLVIRYGVFIYGIEFGTPGVLLGFTMLCDVIS